MTLLIQSSHLSLYRLGVGILLINPDNKLFIGQRYSTTTEAWQFPQGGILPGEDPDHAMWRELKEEVGIDNAAIIAKSQSWYTYDIPPDIAVRLWNGKFKGQKQLWYILRFHGKDEDINIDTSQPEFRAWKWATPDEAISLAVPFKQGLYARLFEELWPCLFLVS